jgi:Cyclic nucleotide-binding domain/Major Facilitator Superfamily
VVESTVWARIRKRLGDSTRAFSTNAHNPNLRRAQLSFGAAWTAEWALTVAIGVVAFRDGGVAAVGIVGFVRMAPSALLAPFGTALGDRLPRERVLVWSCLIRAAATGAAALLLATGGSIIEVYALVAIATAAFTVFRPVHSALLPVLSMTPLELTSANVVRGLLDSVSVLIGPLAAALLLDVGSAAAVFALAAGLSLWSGLLLLRVSYEAPPRETPPALSRIVAEIVEGFRALRRYRDAGLLIGLGLAQTFTRGCLNVFVVVVALELLETGEPGVGVLSAAVGAGAVAGSLGASMLVSGRRLAAIEGIGVALWGLPLTFSGAFPAEPAVLALMGVIGGGNALVDIGLYTGVQRLVPEFLLARVFGALESLTALTVAIGALVTPLAIELLGIRGALAVLGLVAPVLVALAWRRLRILDGSIAHRDEEIGVLKKVGMLRPLPMPAIENLAVHVGHTALAAGQEVFHQGDSGDRFYVIEDGEADVIGDGRFIRTMGPGEGFGEIALLRGTVRTTTVRARTPVALYTLDRRHFLSAVGGYQSSAHEADELMEDRLDAFDPRGIRT